MILLLVLIYLAFIGLGLPDSLLGSAWPAMYGGLGVPIERAGLISIILSAGTVVSSLFSDRTVRRFGAGKVTAVSVALTAAALLGSSFSGDYWLLCVLAVPLGLGAGSVDAVLNNFVALHYKASHMSWLHCFWGVGASLGPAAIAAGLAWFGSWNAGYRMVGAALFALAGVLTLSLPLWRKAPEAERTENSKKGVPIRVLFKLPGAKQVLLSFVFYCSLEATVGLWGSTYLVTVRGVEATVAAGWISLYYAGITFGRLLSGFAALKVGGRQLIHLGQALVLAGIAVTLLPGFFTPAGLFLTGLGLAPIYPSLVHDTPANFGREHSQAMIGFQMAFAYAGATCMPPLFGLLGAKVTYGLLPVFLAALLAMMVLMVVRLYQKTGKQRSE
ncbi:MAG: MFS transporter [Oscillospiraceae bacterium]|jgi:fucose permease|nr:MFS transporter [Oscillospiraceae bacterium]